MTQRLDYPPISGRDSNELTAVLILACGDHVPLLEDILDRGEVLTWTVLPATQSRRLGFLQNLARRNSRTCSVIIAFGEAASLERAVGVIREARDRHELCQECAIFRWPVQQMAEMTLEMDPVCDEAVDPFRSISYRRGGETFHFCSEACRNAFVADPAKYIERRDSPYRVARRDVRRDAPRPAAEQTRREV